MVLGAVEIAQAVGVFVDCEADLAGVEPGVEPGFALVRALIAVAVAIGGEDL